MAKEYYLQFGVGNPTLTTGLAPTFVVFKSWTGGAVSPPGITQPVANYGLYRFEYEPSFSIIFVADGNTSSLSSTARYLSGNLDPADCIDERMAEYGTTLVAIGTSQIAQGVTSIAIGLTNIALGNTSIALETTNSVNIIGYGTTTVALGNTILSLSTSDGSGVSAILAVLGTTASSYGSTGVDPGDVIGYLKRLQENLEGTANFDKSTGIWQIQTRGGTLLAQRTLSNSASSVTKT